MELGDAKTAAVTVDLVEAEYVAALRAANGRLAATQSRRALVLPVAALVLLGVLAVQSWRSGEWAAAGAMLALAVAVCLLWIVEQRRGLYRRLAAQQSSSFTLTVQPGGLEAVSDRGRFFYHWNALESVERTWDGALLHLQGFQVLWVPVRCFPEREGFEAFCTALAQASGRQASADQPAPAPLPPSTEQPWRDWGSNLAAGALLLGFRSNGIARLRPSVPQFLLLAATSVATGFLIDLLQVGAAGTLNVAALPALGLEVVLALLVGWTVARTEGRAGDPVAGAMALVAIWLVIGVVIGLLDVLPVALFNPYSGSGGLIRIALLLWATVASIVALARLYGLAPEVRLSAVFAVIYLFLAPLMLAAEQGHLWVQDYAEEETAAQRERWEAPAREAVLYAQPRLLEEALAGVAAGKPGVPELFLVVVGGHGGQDVFLREADAVGKLFDERFQTRGRSVVLVNNPATVLEKPMANVTTLARTLKTLGQRMNAEDVLFLFMTSHGSDQYRFDLSLWPYRFEELTPQILRRLLDEAGIRHRVVLVSACYSGGFVQPLAGADTLVMTAARADRNSHGCSHEAEWTFFGKAFFTEGLLQAGSFKDAFAIARDNVARRERAEGYEPSEPQIAIGADVERALRPLEARWPRPGGVSGG